MPRTFRLPYDGPQPGGSALPPKSKGRGKALGRIKNVPVKKAAGLANAAARKTSARKAALPKRRTR